jgi:hypothetical protein
MFGNSAPLEHMMLFPEILEDSDERSKDEQPLNKERTLFVTK